MKSRNLVDIHKAPIEDGYHHALATKPTVVQSLATQRRNLRIGRTISLAIALPGTQFLTEGSTFALTHRVGRGKDLHLARNEGQFLQSPELLLLMNTHQQGVVPLAPPHNLYPGLAHSLHIGRSHRQVGKVDSQLLSLASFNRA